MRIDGMSMPGVSVENLDEAVVRYTTLFGLEFEIMQLGVEYPVHHALGSSDISTPSLLSVGHLATDRTECSELVE